MKSDMNFRATNHIISSSRSALRLGKAQVVQTLVLAYFAESFPCSAQGHPELRQHSEREQQRVQHTTLPAAFTVTRSPLTPSSKDKLQIHCSTTQDYPLLTTMAAITPKSALYSLCYVGEQGQGATACPGGRQLSLDVGALGASLQSLRHRPIACHLANCIQQRQRKCL